MDPVKIFTITDLHFGNSQTKTDEVVKSCRGIISDNSDILSDIDIILLTGDTFDKLLATNSIDYISAIEWLSELAIYCDNRNIYLRILEGTPSHDNCQMSAVSIMIQSLCPNLNYKYVDKIEVEIIPELDFSILYIPDHGSIDSSIILSDVREIMNNSNIDKVALIAIHGQFETHLPIYSNVSHINKIYSDMTYGYIVCGHIHTHSVIGNLITTGSLDRLAHNEEEDKGGVYINISKTIKKYKFIPNHRAKKYITVNIEDVELDMLINMINDLRLPRGSHISIKANDRHTLSLIWSELVIKFDMYVLRNNSKADTIETNKKTYDIEIVDITKNNIVELSEKIAIKKRINTKAINIIKEFNKGEEK